MFIKEGEEMFKIAKAKIIDNYKIETSIANISKNNNGSVIEYKALSVDIINDKYSLSFTIDKDINEILNIKKYDKMLIPKENFSESFFTDIEKNITSPLNIYNMIINMFNDALGITFDFNNNEYFGNVDIEIKLNQIK
jgi:hypothetical protein